MISLGLSFSLRASLALGTGNQKAIYGTSMFFNYMAAVCVLNMAFILYDTTPMLKNPLVSTERHGRHGVLFLMAFVPFVLLVCGVALMFNPPSVAGRPVGVNLLRALQVLVVLAAMLIVLSFSAQYEAIREVVPVEKIAAALIASLMLALWGVFMCVRSYLPLSNAARDSELVFLFMNYLPITTASAVATAISDILSDCLEQSASAVAQVEAYDIPTRIAHPAMVSESATDMEAYESVASLSTAFTHSISDIPQAEDEEDAYVGLDSQKETSSTTNEDIVEPEKSSRTAQIYCTKLNCTSERDWLTAAPNAAAGWALGGVSLASALVLSVPTVVWRNLAFIDGVLGLVELSVALFLRASLGKAGTHAPAIYKASLFFNHHAAIELLLLLAVMAIRLHTHYNPVMAPRQMMWVGVARFASFCLAAMALVGVLLMFNSTSADPLAADGSGMHVIQTVTFTMLAATLGVGLLAMRMSFNTGVWFYRKHFAALLVALFLVTLWAAFMSARSLVPLDSVARDSEVVFYLLNIMPLLLVGAVLVALRAPLLYNFERTADWKCDV
ncbi:hypothetical protein EV175_000254 [Coemansia sp. RSA 1933]|nr:hypothetical protein EV175_000254 [Coemansia sp. RSA 1933]